MPVVYRRDLSVASSRITKAAVAGVLALSAVLLVGAGVGADHGGQIRADGNLTAATATTPAPAPVVTPTPGDVTWGG
jgi:hypothetical protein